MATSPNARLKKYRCERCDEPTNAPPGTGRFAAGLCSDCFGKGEDKRPRDLNELEGREWAQASKSVEQYPDTRSEKQRFHGASFPMSLALQQISIYTKPGQTVLDPFLGVGTTLDACSDLGRSGIGIELNEEFADIARRDLEGRVGGDQQDVIVGDACRLTENVKPESVDFVLTSPPYGSLLKNVKGAFANKWREHSMINPVANPRPYSSNPEDLGNLEYGPFLEAIQTCLTETFEVMKSNTYAVWVVKDFRAVKEGVPYVNFHGDIANRAEMAGFTLWDIRIYDQTKFRPLVCLGFPSRNFYLNIGHSYLIVLKKK
jgi:DNA modification methylase